MVIKEERLFLTANKKIGETLFVSTHRKRNTIGQFIIIPTDPYGLPLGPVTHPFSTKPKNSKFLILIKNSPVL